MHHPESNFCTKIPPQSKDFQKENLIPGGNFFQTAPQSADIQKAVRKVQAIGLAIDMALGRKEKWQASKLRSTWSRGVTFCHVSWRSQPTKPLISKQHASARNQIRVTSMATMYSTTRPLMLLRKPKAERSFLQVFCLPASA